MGYVKFTEQVGEISKTYEFGSYEDFKDWENGEELFVETDGWIENTGVKPNLPGDTVVEVKFNDGTTAEDTVGAWYWPTSTDSDWFDGEITHYQVVNK